MARKTGRNEPCPCGSGRKYKHCCLKKALQRPHFTSEDRVSALLKLLRALEELADQDPEWQKQENALANEFWGDLKGAQLELDNEYVTEISGAAFRDWLFFDVMLDPRLRALDLVLKHAPAFDAGELRWLERQTALSLRLYEVTEVRRGSALTLRDLLSGSEVTVRERLGSQTLTRWDLLAARVMPIGASGQPEMDGAAFHFPRLHRERALGQLRSRLAELREEHPAANETDLLKLCAPEVHQMWLSLWVTPPVPELLTTTGEAMLMTSVLFDVADADALTRALDRSAALEREPGQTRWLWYEPNPEAEGGPDATILGTVTLGGDRLTLETLSRERGAQARALVEDLAGTAVRYRVTSHEDPRREIQEGMREGRGSEGRAAPPDEAADEILRHYEAHYRRWVDEPVPALDGATPRAAASSGRLRPRLVAMLRDLEQMYLRSLSEGQPAYDSSWMWPELGLEDHPDAPPCWRERPPRLGHESMERFVAGIGDAAREIARLHGDRYNGWIDAVVTQEQLADDFVFVRFLRAQAEAAHRDGADDATATRHANLVGAHLEYLCNHELHHRKTFWVDGALSWQLAHTVLDLTGDLLRLPFASCAFVFTDRHFLGLAERTMATDPDCGLRGQMIRVATVYLSQTSVGDGSRLRLAFVFDTLGDEWPWLLVRELQIDADARLDAILDSHVPDVDPARLAPVFTAAATRRLVNIVLNAILYATSSGAETEVRSLLGADPPAATQVLSSEEVYYLPGRIEISRLRQMQAVEKAASGRRLMHRFMVRGHWRRANPSWKDQRHRWIRPHWKGPDIAAIIEREYQLRE